MKQEFLKIKLTFLQKIAKLLAVFTKSCVFGTVSIFYEKIVFDTVYILFVSN